MCTSSFSLPVIRATYSCKITRCVILHPSYLKKPEPFKLLKFKHHINKSYRKQWSNVTSIMHSGRIEVALLILVDRLEPDLDLCVHSLFGDSYGGFGHSAGIISVETPVNLVWNLMRSGTQGHL